MMVSHDRGAHDVDVEAPADLFAVGPAGDAHFNEYWFWPRGGGQSPALAVLVAGDLAHVSWFPVCGHPGFVSCARSGSPAAEGLVEFRVGGEVTEPLADHVIAIDDAITAVREFFACTTAPPPSLTWFEL
jgi:hypothetical protein